MKLICSTARQKKIETCHKDCNMIILIRYKNTVNNYVKFN